jgi:hypothetical protein
MITWNSSIINLGYLFPNLMKSLWKSVVVKRFVNRLQSCQGIMIENSQGACLLLGNETEFGWWEHSGPVTKEAEELGPTSDISRSFVGLQHFEGPPALSCDQAGLFWWFRWPPSSWVGGITLWLGCCPADSKPQMPLEKIRKTERHRLMVSSLMIEICLVCPRNLLVQAHGSNKTLKDENKKRQGIIVSSPRQP